MFHVEQNKKPPVKGVRCSEHLTAGAGLCQSVGATQTRGILHGLSPSCQGRRKRARLYPLGPITQARTTGEQAGYDKGEYSGANRQIPRFEEASCQKLKTSNIAQYQP